MQTGTGRPRRSLCKHTLLTEGHRRPAHRCRERNSAVERTRTVVINLPHRSFERFLRPFKLRPLRWADRRRVWAETVEKLHELPSCATNLVELFGDCCRKFLPP